MTMTPTSFVPLKRAAKIHRKTKETDIEVELSLGEAPFGVPEAEVSTGIGFLDHMLGAFARHGGFFLKLKCEGDLHIDQHHTVEDTGLALGSAFALALGDHAGIKRFGMMECPLDEALAKCVVDISGRPYVHFGVTFARPFIGQLDSSLLREFFGGFVQQARWTLHCDVMRGENDHHKAEALFKAFGRAAHEACMLSGVAGVIPSTKGTLV